MTYENLGSVIGNLIHDKKNNRIKHIYTDILAMYADYGICTPLKITLLKYDNLHLYSEIKEIIEVTKLGINPEQEPYVTMIINVLDEIVKENFDNNNDTMLTKTSDRQTQINIITKVTELSEKIKNNPFYIEEVNTFIAKLQKQYGQELTRKMLDNGVNISAKKYLSFLMYILEQEENIFPYIASLSTDDIKLCYSMLMLLKIRNRYDETKNIVFDLIREGRLLDLYNLYISILYENDKIQFVDNLIDNVDSVYEIDIPEAQKLRDYLHPKNQYISYDERQLVVIRNGKTKYKNYNEEKANNLSLKK